MAEHAAADTIALAQRLDALSARWLASLASAEAALRHAALTPDERAARDRRLKEQRASAAALLADLARGWALEPLLAGAVGSARSDTGLLGLPGGIRACVFDLDGVLTCSDALHGAAWADALDEFLHACAQRQRRDFLPFDPVADHALHMAGRPRLEGVRAFLASRGVSVPEGEPGDEPGTATVHGIANRKRERLAARLAREGVAASAGAASYLDVARILGVRRAVVSPSASTEPILRSARIEHLIDRRVDGGAIAAEHLRPKPDPDTLVAACAALGVEPEATAAFETTPAGVAAARRAGFRVVVGVAPPDAPALLRASDADIVVVGLGELLRRGLAA